jgi:hypothetical protein
VQKQIKSGIRGQIDWPNIAGDVWSARFRIMRNGVYPANWTGYTFVGQVRRYANPDADLIATIAFSLSEGDGWVTMTATPQAGVTAGNYYYDVKWIPPGGNLRTLFGGKFPIGSSVTAPEPEAP